MSFIGRMMVASMWLIVVFVACILVVPYIALKGMVKGCEVFSNWLFNFGGYGG